MRGDPRSRTALKPRNHNYTLCYIELERAATYSRYHFLRFQKCLNEANIAKINDFRAGDHGHFDG